MNGWPLKLTKQVKWFFMNKKHDLQHSMSLMMKLILLDQSSTMDWMIGCMNYAQVTWHVF
jgi:hypothetical protein